MKSRLSLAAVASAALLLSSVPGWAIQTITLPQNSDGTTNFQDPDAQAQSKFSTDQNGNMKVEGLGNFHFSMQSQSGLVGGPNDPGYYYRPGSSSPAGYGAANVPGSEFYNSGYPFPH
jgi:hypothetical protein